MDGDGSAPSSMVAAIFAIRLMLGIDWQSMALRTTIRRVALLGRDIQVICVAIADRVEHARVVTIMEDSTQIPPWPTGDSMLQKTLRACWQNKQRRPGPGTSFFFLYTQDGTTGLERAVGDGGAPICLTPASDKGWQLVSHRLRIRRTLL